MSGRKAELAEEVYYTWKLKLEVAKTAREEDNDVSTRRREKLTIESIVSLPFPSSLLRRIGRGKSLNFQTFWRMR